MFGTALKFAMPLPSETYFVTQFLPLIYSYSKQVFSELNKTSYDDEG